MSVNVIKLPIVLLVFLAILIAAGSGVHGPFVFGDESVYRGMIYAFARGLGLSGYKQYGPLFPFLVALTEHLFSVENIYHLAKSLNIFFALIALIPFWKFAQDLLGKHWLFWAAIAGFVLSPFWTYTAVTWAEPLFYCLFFWSVYFIRAASVRIASGSAGKWFFASGVTCGLIFLAKPADIVYGAALSVGYLLVYRREIIQNSRYQAGFICLLLGWLLLVVPFVLRNIFLEHTAALGYPYVGVLLRKLIENTSVLKVAGFYLASLGYHLSYLLMAGFGSLFAVYYLLLLFWKDISSSDKLLLLYLGASLTAICLLSSVHMIIFPPDGFRTPNGRYLTQFTPVLVCMLLYMYKNYFSASRMRSTARHLPLFLSAPLLVLLASPLCVLGAFMVVNGPDLAVYFLMIEGKHLPWRSQYSPEIYELFLPAGVTLLGLLPFMFRWKPRLVGSVVISIWMSFLVAGLFNQSWLMHTMASTQEKMNKLFHRSSVGLTSVNLCAKNVYYDAVLENSGIPFLYQYWCPANKINYLNRSASTNQAMVETIKKPTGFIFTKKSSPHELSVIDQVEGYSLFKISFSQ